MSTTESIALIVGIGSGCVSLALFAGVFLHRKLYPRERD